MIKLKTPVTYAIGNERYTHAKVLFINTEVELQKITLMVAYGYLDDTGRFMKGRYPVQSFEITNKYVPDADNQPVLQSADFDAVTSSTPQGDETIWEAVCRIYDEWLLEKNHFQGSIV